MKPEFEAQVFAILEQMEIAAARPEYKKLSIAVWSSTGPCPHCDGQPQTANP
jgi:hypothetical protein